MNTPDFQLQLLTEGKTEVEIGQPSQKLKPAFKLAQLLTGLRSSVPTLSATRNKNEFSCEQGTIIQKLKLLLQYRDLKKKFFL